MSCAARRGKWTVTCHAVEGRPVSNRVLIIGGTGRVGRSAALSLLKTDPDLHITLAGRQQRNFDALVQSTEQLEKTRFTQVDLEDATRLRVTFTLSHSLCSRERLGCRGHCRSRHSYSWAVSAVGQMCCFGGCDRNEDILSRYLRRCIDDKAVSESTPSLRGKQGCDPYIARV